MNLFAARVSSVFWLLHYDFHDMKAAAAFEYMSSMVATIKPLTTSTNVLRENNDSISLLEQNYKRGQFHASLKRRNGRVRVMIEEVSVEQSHIKFTTMSAVENAAHIVLFLSRCNSICSYLIKNEAIEQMLCFHLSTRKRGNQFKFMMVVNLSPRANTNQMVHQLRKYKNMMIQVGKRSHIFVIQMTRCLILMKTQTMIWTYKSTH